MSKRPVPDPSAPKPKRIAESATIVLDNENDNDSFQITVKLDKKFNVFPTELLNTIQQTHQNTLKTALSYLRTNMLPFPKPTYIQVTVIGRCIRSSKSNFQYAMLPRVKKSSSYSLANMDTLKVMVKKPLCNLITIVL